MKIFLLLPDFTAYLSAFRSLAQSGSLHQRSPLQGTVLDSVNNKPMGYVTVAVQDSKTHTL